MRVLLIETSHQRGWVALAEEGHVLSQQPLEESRRHARDLAPALAKLLETQQWRARDLNAVFASKGPGSYTGLRVGLMSAKTLAYATGASLVGVETFAAIALQAPAEAQRVDVIADAQQDKIYVQSFERASSGWKAISALTVQSFEKWQADVQPTTWISGPGIESLEERLSRQKCVGADGRYPLPESVLRIGLEKLARGEKDDPFALEPLYLRPSSAEEKWAASHV